MGILKTAYKIKASSLVETIIATIIITIIFTIATVSVTRILKQSIDNNTHEIDTHLEKLSYQYIHGFIKTPDTFEKGAWDIEVKEVLEQDITFILFKAKHRNSNRQRVKRIVP
ncbi:MAG: hypothetical protein JXQ93_03395 [Flavobacteriaceae bacterium]